MLGDWYATLPPWRPQVALLVNERTLLPALMPLAPAATMPARVADQVGEVLAAQSVPDPAHFNPVVSTVDRCLGRRTGTGLTARGLAAYVPAQVMGAIAGAVLADLTKPSRSA
ncbi:hypothetical protein AB0L34_05915 [Micromonospora sp. NPDC052213]|uniref:DUF6933 domain-containing protein n=1 Tax=Micromonospora sp. NPDC052213 TaxID=3155812 RepID=UPI003414F0D9